LMDIKVFIIIVLSSYGFAVGVQIIRGKYLNFKPLNCKTCISFWFALACFLLLKTPIVSAIVSAFAVACICYFLSIIEAKITAGGIENHKGGG